jgi:hypothetical protein
MPTVHYADAALGLRRDATSGIGADAAVSGRSRCVSFDAAGPRDCRRTGTLPRPSRDSCRVGTRFFARRRAPSLGGHRRGTWAARASQPERSTVASRAVRASRPPSIRSTDLPHVSGRQQLRADSMLKFGYPFDRDQVPRKRSRRGNVLAARTHGLTDTQRRAATWQRGTGWGRSHPRQIELVSVLEFARTSIRAWSETRPHGGLVLLVPRLQAPFRRVWAGVCPGPGCVASVVNVVNRQIRRRRFGGPARRWRRPGRGRR